MAAIPNPPRTPRVSILKLPLCPECSMLGWVTAPGGATICRSCGHKLTISDLIGARHQVLTPDDFYKDVLGGETHEEDI